MKKTSTLLLILASVSTISIAQVQRMVLHEVFSSSTCPPCVAGNVNLKTVFNANPNKFTCVKHQCWFPGAGDPYYISDASTRLGYYDTDGSFGIPDMYVNGPNKTNPQTYNQGQFDVHYGMPADMTINATYDISGTSITVNASIVSGSDISGSTNRLHMAVVERKTTGNVGTNGETSFYYVNMKMLPNASGTVVGPFTANTAITKTATFNMASTFVEDMWELSVVCWVQDNSDKSVRQSAWAVKMSGVEDAASQNGGIIALYPNPASQEATLRYQVKNSNTVKVDVLNSIGQIVYTKNEGVQTAGDYALDINTKNLSTGLYYVRLTVGNNVITDKLSVVR